MLNLQQPTPHRSSHLIWYSFVCKKTVENSIFREINMDILFKGENVFPFLNRKSSCLMYIIFYLSIQGRDNWYIFFAIIKSLVLNLFVIPELRLIEFNRKRLLGLVWRKSLCNWHFVEILSIGISSLLHGIWIWLFHFL
jgi:hypothetical protein